MTTANILNTKIVYSETKVFPYYDDFDESKNFHKILFRPGYAVQARELTQLQTILQSQIERFGSHIFQNGSLVMGGQLGIDRSPTHINLESTYIGTNIDPATFVGKYIQWSANNRARAYVLASQDATANTPAMLAIKYVTGKKFGHGDTIKVSDEETYANLTSSGSNGACALVSMSEGIFFINGYFVKAPPQTIVASAFSSFANTKIGLQFTPSIVDENSDVTLLDPAQEASNYQAPGAARFVIDLELDTRPLDSSDDESQFIELMKIQKGVVRKWVKEPIYSEIEKTFARRTMDESGSYTVRPFLIGFKDHATDDTKVIATLSSGKAYIEGHEFETIAETEIELNRARTSKAVNNYDITCNYGNYFVGQNLNGTFDHTTFALADIHSVPYEFITRTSQTLYDSTKIGTARIRNVIYYGSANAANAGDRTYKISLTDTRFTKLQTNANVTAALTSNTIGLWSPSNLLSSNTDAYRGASLRLKKDATIGTFKIVAWDGTTKVATLSSNLTFTPTGTTNAIISFDMASAESLTISSLTSGSPSDRANVNFSTASKFPVDPTGEAYLAESELDSLVFRYPQSYLKPGSISDQDIAYRKKFSTTFTANSATIAVDATKEAFSGNVSGSTSSTLLSNYLVIGSTGGVVKLTAVSVDGTQTATLTAENYSGAATVFATVNLNAGNNTKPKRKTLITGNTSHFVRHAANATLMAGLVNTSIYLVAGQISIRRPLLSPNEKIPLYVSDVKRITAIYDMNSDSEPAVRLPLASYTNYKNDFIFHTGQTDSFYDHAYISASPYSSRRHKGTLLVCFDYYDHGAGETDDGLGYFSVDSYPNANTTAGYADIPSYTMSDGSVVELRDCIDFRPKRTNADNTSPAFTLSGIRIPLINSEFTSDYEYYLPRRDRIELTTNPNSPFMVVEGIPSQFPVEPKGLENSMTLYKILMPAYTESYKDVMSKFVENKRYTMRDIGLLEKRIENLEYYQSLSRLESAASSTVILDEFGLERTKYGIMVDDFTGHSVGDVLNLDYLCGIDKIEGALTPAWLRREFPLYAAELTDTINTNESLYLDYSEVSFIAQPLASKVVNVQPFMFANFVGDIVLRPHVVTFVSTNIAPIVII